MELVELNWLELYMIYLFLLNCVDPSYLEGPESAQSASPNDQKPVHHRKFSLYKAHLDISRLPEKCMLAI